MNRSHVSFSAAPIPIGSITDYDAGTLGWWSFGNGASLGRGVLNNIELIGKRRRR
jgi:hypothetical protein